MAEEKMIVTKKTQARKAAPKEGVSKKTPETPRASAKTATASKSAAPAPATRATRKTAPRGSTTGTTPARSTRKKTPVAASVPSAPPEGQLSQFVDITPEQRLAMIQEAAYYKAEKRNFVAGHENSDWIEAERDIDELIARARAIHHGKTG